MDLSSVFDKKWGILIKKESESLIFTGLKIPRDYSVSGGGDIPETAIDALEMARQLDMRSSSQKFFILVTDAGYKVANNYGIHSMNEMINLLIADGFVGMKE